MNEITRPTSIILDEYCRYYSDFSKILNIYIKNLYPKINFQFDQLLNASFHVWHSLTDDEKISLGTFIEQINNKPENIPPSAPTGNYPLKRTMSIITPYKMFLKDQRRQMRRKHSNMSMKEMNQRLAKRWKHLSKRIKQTYKTRANLAKKRISQSLFKE